jgi:hypothetical protein
MAYQYYNRYSDFLINGEQTVVPFVQLPQKTTEWRGSKNNFPPDEATIVADLKGTKN